jgi:DNA-binding transcriptional ArsR family regulator
MTTVTLDLPWLPVAARAVDGLMIVRGHTNALRYDDSIELAVQLIDPSDFESPEALLDAVVAQPGTVSLVAGAVPLSWRARLRSCGVSFLDVSGVIEITWPRIRVSGSRSFETVQRHRSPLPFQKGYGRVVQQLAASALAGQILTISELAEQANSNPSSVSRAVAQLVEHGLVTKVRDSGRTVIDVVDAVQLAELLAERSVWPNGQTVSGYMWGRTVWEVATLIGDNARRNQIVVAVTGRTALAYLRVMATSSPPDVRVWVDTLGQDPADIASLLGLEPAPADESNVTLSADPWHVGTHRHSMRSFDGLNAPIAHPVRVWCDVQAEPRGTEFAAQLWKVMRNGG